MRCSRKIARLADAKLDRFTYDERLESDSTPVASHRLNAAVTNRGLILAVRSKA